MNGRTDRRTFLQTFRIPTKKLNHVFVINLKQNTIIIIITFAIKHIYVRILGYAGILCYFRNKNQKAYFLYSYLNLKCFVDI